MDLDAVLLARWQFALTIMFHYLFPPLSIGLGALMVIMEGLYLKTGEKQYEAIARFWTSIFAVVFAMGVASGIVMEFQFGTNWSTYSSFVGDIFGAALAAEGIFAFFLESGFLAVLVFGWDRVGKKMHFFSTCMVALGAIFSSIWIVVANAWQQHPVGYHIVDMTKADGSPLIINGEVAQRAEVTDFFAVVLNPDAWIRLFHVWVAAGILGAFFVMSLAAFYMLKKRELPYARRMMQVALPIAIGLSLLMFLSGDIQAKATAEYQPAKLAAFEGHFETSDGGAPFYLFGWPDQEAAEVKYGLAVPGGLSMLLYLDPSKPVTALDQFPRDEWPPVLMTFMTYHVMIGLATYFVLITLVAGYFYYFKKNLEEQRWLLWILIVSVIAPYIANQAGWVTAEVGRQPWVVYGLLKTAEAASPSVPAWQILVSIILFGIVYFLLFIIWLIVLDHKIRRGASFFDKTATAEGPREGFIEAAAEVAGRTGPSYTEARQDDNEETNTPPSGDQ